MSVRKLTSAEVFEHLPFHINKYSYTNSDEIEMHTHDFIEIVYICDGKGLHVYNGKTYSVSKGDLYIINFDTAHCFYPTDKENSENLVVYNCMFQTEFLNDLNLQLPILLELTDIVLYKSLYSEEIDYTSDLRLHGAQLTDIENLYSKMYLEYSIRQPHYIDIIKLLLCELLLKLHRAYKMQLYAENDVGRIYKHQLILDCIDYLKQNYSNRITIDELSNYAFLSKSYLSYLFKKVTGTNVVDYLQHIRIEKAIELLTDEKLSITEICNAVGYSDYRFFNKSFKKITGLTAQQYRKKMDL